MYDTSYVIAVPNAVVPSGAGFPKTKQTGFKTRFRQAGLLPLVGAALLSLAACGGGRGSGPVIELGGSTSMVPLVELLAEGFGEHRPGIRLNINSTGSSDGIRNAGVLYQFGMTSRELTPSEQLLGLYERVIAIDGIALIVHSSNPVSDLSVETVRGIYTGEITDWAEVSGGSKRGTIAVVTREEGSGTRSAFEEIVGFSGNLRAGAVESPSSGAVRSNVAGNPDAVGYVSAASVDGSVRALSIDGFEPSDDNLRSGSYAIARPFILLYDEPSPEGREFLEWVLGEGQAIVARSWLPVGPVPDGNDR